MKKLFFVIAILATFFTNVANAQITKLPAGATKPQPFTYPDGSKPDPNLKCALLSFAEIGEPVFQSWKAEYPNVYASLTFTTQLYNGGAPLNLGDGGSAYIVFSTGGNVIRRIPVTLPIAKGASFSSTIYYGNVCEVFMMPEKTNKYVLISSDFEITVCLEIYGKNNNLCGPPVCVKKKFICFS